jgi:hypothetical protein
MRLCLDEHEIWRQVMVATAVGAQVPAIWQARNCPVANGVIDAALSPNRDESSARKVKSAAKKALDRR